MTNIERLKKYLDDNIETLNRLIEVRNEFLHSSEYYTGMREAFLEISNLIEVGFLDD